MLHTFSWFRVTDNSGVTLAKCIRVFKRGRSERGSLGDVVAVVSKHVVSAGKRKQRMKTGAIFKALIVRQKSFSTRKTGQWKAYSDNSIILFGAGPAYVKAGIFTPLSKRIYGPTSFELRFKGFSRVVSLSRRVT